MPPKLQVIAENNYLQLFRSCKQTVIGKEDLVLDNKYSRKDGTLVEDRPLEQCDPSTLSNFQDLTTQEQEIYFTVDRKGPI